MTLRGRSNAKKWKLHGKPASAGEVREFVFDRDRHYALRHGIATGSACLAATFEVVDHVPDLDRHVCGSAFGYTRGGGETLEHVTRVHGEEGRRNDERHTVALCGTLNGETMTLADRDMKDRFREYLRDLYPTCASG